MPRFPVSFGKRRSTADSHDHAPAEPSFRVLERTDASNVKSFDGGKRMMSAAKTYQPVKTAMSVDLSPMDDNIFLDMKNNRGSGVSNNTTKSSLTDTSSRHSNASTAPSSTTDLTPLDDAKTPARKQYDNGSGIPAVPPLPKNSPNGFLRAAGRTFSFGGSKKTSPPTSVPEEPMPRPFTSDVSTPERISPLGRARATTSSTSSTATPPKLEEEFDLGGDFSKMLSFDKRQSVMTLKGENASDRQALGPRSLTGNRLNQPAPLHIDKSSRIEASPLSWNSHNSGEGLLVASPNLAAQPRTNENVPPPVPKHTSNKLSSPSEPGPQRRSATYGNRNSAEAEDEDTLLLTDISAASKFLSTNNTPTQGAGRYRRNEDTLGIGFRQVQSESHLSRLDSKDDDNLFDTGLAASSRAANRYVSRRPSPPRNKVMTPAQFERYRQDKERQNSPLDETTPSKDNDDEEDEINYDDDEDEVEKSKEAAKQRRKQEAHMAVYRQQMMKVTGEPSSGHQSRPSIALSFSTPNLFNPQGQSPPKSSGNSEGEEEDEEVPLAILAAHGFPNKNRPPTRLSAMMSNPNLRAAAQAPSYQRPGSVADGAHAPPAPQGGGGGGGSGGRLPVFARNLPQDPYVGAGLINHAPRESLSFSGGSPAAGVPPGGLVGVIASEERSRALRRGSPSVDAHKPMLSFGGGTGGFDPMAGIPPNMMYPSAHQQKPSTDQTQMQMNQQMTQFMQMQMQFMQMQMMANQGGGNRMSMVMPNMSMGMMGPGGMMGMGMGGPETMRHSFMDNGSVYDMPIRPESHMRSMSMVQPSSASWIQPPPNPGYAPSIRIQGANGYAPSIAPSERSNIGLPGRYRPVSHMPAPKTSASPSLPSPLDHNRMSSMSGALGGGGWDQNRTKSPLQSSAVQASDDEDDEEAWTAMKQKREKKRSLWKTKKSIGGDISAMIR
ncbi:hypothetical protein RB597_008099 [Gaeumannomyces tritici]